jgi:hypothetical protein
LFVLLGGDVCGFFFSLWYLDSILSAVVYEDQVLSASPCLPSSSSSAVTFPGRFFPERFTMLVRAFPNLELLAVGVAACGLPAACGLQLPKHSWLLDSERRLHWAAVAPPHIILGVCRAAIRLTGLAAVVQFIRHTGLRVVQSPGLPHWASHRT